MDTRIRNVDSAVTRDHRSVTQRAPCTAPHDGRRPCDGARPMRPTHGNAVTHWNAVAGEAFAPTQGTNPLAQSRTLAILHAAIHDVLNAIDRRFEPYTPGLAAAPGASADAAVAAAAREVLIALVPDQTALVDAAYERALTSVA